MDITTGIHGILLDGGKVQILKMRKRYAHVPAISMTAMSKIKRILGCE
jgi:hypothetical protein